MAVSCTFYHPHLLVRRADFKWKASGVWLTKRVRLTAANFLRASAIVPPTIVHGVARFLQFNVSLQCLLVVFRI